MSDNRGPDWLDDATAERLLRGTADSADERAAALAGLLAAVSAPAALDPAREEAAVAAFRVARDKGALSSGVRHRHRRRADDWRPRRLRHAVRSAKAVTGALVATAALGGVAVAAAVGALPTSFGGAVPGPTPVHSGGSGPQAGPSGPGESGSTSDPDQERPAGGASRGVTGTTPSASADSTDYEALCKAYAAVDWQRQGMDRQAYQRLENRAGGSGNQVRRYCAGLLGRGVEDSGKESSGDNSRPGDSDSGDSQGTKRDGNDTSDETSDESSDDSGSKASSQKANQ